MQETVPPFALGLMLGGMGMFSFLVAPLAFRSLPAEMAARFVRAFFPHYWLFTAVAAAFAAVALVGPAPVAAMALAAAAAAGALARQALTPRINALRDRQLAGDAAAGKWFGRLHGLSVAVNLAQMLAAAGALAWAL